MHIFILILIETTIILITTYNSQCNSPHPSRHTHNIGNSQVNAINPQSPSASDLIGSLQSQILGL